MAREKDAPWRGAGGVPRAPDPPEPEGRGGGEGSRDLDPDGRGDGEESRDRDPLCWELSWMRGILYFWPLPLAELLKIGTLEYIFINLSGNFKLYLLSKSPNSCCLAQNFLSSSASASARSACSLSARF